MKVLPALVSAFGQSRSSRMNLRLLMQVGGVVVLTVILFSVLFQVFMRMEGQSHSWVTAFYWTVVTMTTLGYGDITFHSDAGEVFSIIVLSVGVLMMLVVFPFTFIETIYLPWMQARQQAQAPRKLPRHLRGHVVLTSSDPVAVALIKKLEQFHYSYALIVPDFTEALTLADQGYHVMVGELDDPATYAKAHIHIASLVATTCGRDSMNTNVVSTIRQLSESIPIVASAQETTAMDVLRRAGANYVFHPSEMLGKSLARRVHGGSQRAHTIAGFDDLYIAEATVRGTSLVGKNLVGTGLREATGLNVLGAWKRGQFENAGPQMPITENTVLVLAGSESQIASFNETYPQAQVCDNPVIVIGGGRVGRATAAALAAMGIDYRIVEQYPEDGTDSAKLIQGDAAKLEVIKRAGIDEAPTVIITTRDDDINIYLTIFLRSLRPDILIISRSMRERNLATLHRSGADFVMSHASMGANTIFNLLKRSDVEMLAEGLDLFKVPMPQGLAGRTIAESDIRRQTGCTVAGLRTAAGMQANPDPNSALPESAELLMIGTVECEARFLDKYPVRSSNAIT